jgi:hypothetical protein
MKTFDSFSFSIREKDDTKEITVKPHPEPLKDDKPQSFEIAINGFPRGKIKQNANEWESSDILDEKLVDKIGEEIEKHYQ